MGGGDEDRGDVARQLTRVETAVVHRNRHRLKSGQCDRLAMVPENTHVEPWVEQPDALAAAAVVVCHGGSGTTFGALAAGVPLVVCPLFADQSLNGRLVEAAGAGLLVTPADDFAGAVGALGAADVAPLRAATERVLRDPSYREAAGRVAREMACVPTLDEVLDQLCRR